LSLDVSPDRRTLYLHAVALVLALIASFGTVAVARYAEPGGDE
jgi:multisubunit Na+/H+ antiporter MnhF subunit